MLTVTCMILCVLPYMDFYQLSNYYSTSCVNSGMHTNANVCILSMDFPLLYYIPNMCMCMCSMLMHDRPCTCRWHIIYVQSTSFLTTIHALVLE